MMTYNPRYYEDLIERFGLRKAKDLYAYYAPVFPEPPELLANAARYALKKHPEAKTSGKVRCYYVNFAYSDYSGKRYAGSGLEFYAGVLSTNHVDGMHHLTA